MKKRKLIFILISIVVMIGGVVAFYQLNEKEVEKIDKPIKNEKEVELDDVEEQKFEEVLLTDDEKLALVIFMLEHESFTRAIYDSTSSIELDWIVTNLCDDTPQNYKVRMTNEMENDITKLNLNFTEDYGQLSKYYISLSSVTEYYEKMTGKTAIVEEDSFVDYPELAVSYLYVSKHKIFVCYENWYENFGLPEYLIYRDSSNIATISIDQLLKKVDEDIYVLKTTERSFTYKLGSGEQAEKYDKELLQKTLEDISLNKQTEIDLGMYYYRNDAYVMKKKDGEWQFVSAKNEY